MIVRSTDGTRIIGSIELGTFTKRVRGTVHMLRIPRGWGIDLQPFITSIRPNCHTIIIEAIASGIKYKVSTKLFDDKKMYLNRGFSPQYVLPIKYWMVTTKTQKALF